MPLARRRMRSIVGDLVVDADARAAPPPHRSPARPRGSGSTSTCSARPSWASVRPPPGSPPPSGSSRDPHVDYVSIKICAVAPQLNHWAFDDSLARVAVRLRDLFRAARDASPTVFVNLDMEEYHDLELTIAAFTSVLDEPEFHELRGRHRAAGLPARRVRRAQELIDWAGRRVAGGGADIKIRLVKGANLAMERVDAVMHGWQQAPYPTKLETDANYKRCLDWVLHPSRLVGVRIGVACHNLFDVAWAALTAEEPRRRRPGRVRDAPGHGAGAEPCGPRRHRRPGPLHPGRAGGRLRRGDQLPVPAARGEQRRGQLPALARSPSSPGRPSSTPRPSGSEPRSRTGTRSRRPRGANRIRRSRVAPLPRRPRTSTTSPLLDPTVPADRAFALAAVGTEPAPPTAPIVTSQCRHRRGRGRGRAQPPAPGRRRRRRSVAGSWTGWRTS